VGYHTRGHRFGGYRPIARRAGHLTPARIPRHEGHLRAHYGRPFREYALGMAAWRMHLVRCMSTRHDLPCSGPTRRSESLLAGRVNTASGIVRRRFVCSDRALPQRRRPSDSANSGNLRTAKPAHGGLPASSPLNNGCWRLQMRLFAAGQARMALNEGRSATLQARG